MKMDNEVKSDSIWHNPKQKLDRGTDNIIYLAPQN